MNNRALSHEFQLNKIHQSVTAQVSQIHISTHGNQDGFSADLRSKSFSVGLRREESVAAEEAEEKVKMRRKKMKARSKMMEAKMRTRKQNTP